MRLELRAETELQHPWRIGQRRAGIRLTVSRVLCVQREQGRIEVLSIEQVVHLEDAVDLNLCVMDIRFCRRISTRWIGGRFRLLRAMTVPSARRRPWAEACPAAPSCRTSTPDAASPSRCRQRCRGRSAGSRTALPDTVERHALALSLRVPRVLGHVRGQRDRHVARGSGPGDRTSPGTGSPDSTAADRTLSSAKTCRWPMPASGPPSAS